VSPYPTPSRRRRNLTERALDNPLPLVVVFWLLAFVANIIFWGGLIWLVWFLFF
jgi:hypothetical protein